MHSLPFNFENEYLLEKCAETLVQLGEHDRALDLEKATTTPQGRISVLTAVYKGLDPNSHLATNIQQRIKNIVPTLDEDNNVPVYFQLIDVGLPDQISSTALKNISPATRMRLLGCLATECWKRDEKKKAMLHIEQALSAYNELPPESHNVSGFHKISSAEESLWQLFSKIIKLGLVEILETSIELIEGKYEVGRQNAILGIAYLRAGMRDKALKRFRKLIRFIQLEMHSPVGEPCTMHLLSEMKLIKEIYSALDQKDKEDLLDRCWKQRWGSDVLRDCIESEFEHGNQETGKLLIERVFKIIKNENGRHGFCTYSAWQFLPLTNQYELWDLSFDFATVEQGMDKAWALQSIIAESLNKGRKDICDRALIELEGPGIVEAHYQICFYRALAQISAITGEMKQTHKLYTKALDTIMSTKGISLSHQVDFLSRDAASSGVCDVLLKAIEVQRHALPSFDEKGGWNEACYKHLEVAIKFVIYAATIQRKLKESDKSKVLLEQFVSTHKLHITHALQEVSLEL